MANTVITKDILTQAIKDGKVRCNISALNADRAASILPSEMVTILLNNVERVYDKRYMIDPVANLSAPWKMK